MNRHAFKAVFFDLDGTLVDMHGPLYVAAKNALEALGHRPSLTREDYHAALRRNDLWLGLAEHLRPAYLKLAYAYFFAEVDRTERMEVLPGVLEALTEIKRLGYVTGVVTSRPGDPRRLIEKLAMVGLAVHLDHVLTAETVLLGALDKTEALREAALRAAAATGACVYVGDEPRDVVAARRAGFGAALAVATGPAAVRLLNNQVESPPDFVMRSMGELPGVLDRLAREGDA